MADQVSVAPLWCFTARDEYPPEGVLVWASAWRTNYDEESVFRGQWHAADVGVGEQWMVGKWTDEDGRPIRVNAWLPLEDSPDGPPELPKRFPRMWPPVFGARGEQVERDAFDSSLPRGIGLEEYHYRLWVDYHGLPAERFPGKKPPF